MYEKVVLILEGRGSTEVWQDGQAKRHTFEWAKGSMFTIPLNASHRFINASSQPALMLCGTSAPNVMNLLDNMDFIFNCPYHFTDRYLQQRRFLQAERRHLAGSDPRARHAQDQHHPRRDQCGAAAR